MLVVSSKSISRIVNLFSDREPETYRLASELSLDQVNEIQ